MVLDGNSIINRAYYGVRPLTTRDGFFTHAIFGFLTMLGRLLDQEKPEALCVATPCPKSSPCRCPCSRMCSTR